MNRHAVPLINAANQIREYTRIPFPWALLALDGNANFDLKHQGIKLCSHLINDQDVSCVDIFYDGENLTSISAPVVFITPGTYHVHSVINLPDTCYIFAFGAKIIMHTNAFMNSNALTIFGGEFCDTDTDGGIFFMSPTVRLHYCQLTASTAETLIRTDSLVIENSRVDTQNIVAKPYLAMSMTDVRLVDSDFYAQKIVEFVPSPASGNYLMVYHNRLCSRPGGESNNSKLFDIQITSQSDGDLEIDFCDNVVIFTSGTNVEYLFYINQTSDDFDVNIGSFKSNTYHVPTDNTMNTCWVLYADTGGRFKISGIYELPIAPQGMSVNYVMIS